MTRTSRAGPGGHRSRRWQSGAHLIGGGGLPLAHRGRVRGQSGVGANTAVKTALTAAALGTTAYSGLLGAKLGKASGVPAEGGTVPGDATPGEVARTQQQLRVLQWATPVLTGALVILGAQQGDQQAPGSGSAACEATAADLRPDHPPGTPSLLSNGA